ncbi:MAG: hypothetical protein VB118_11635 [Oscillospiraceae bacterium]|nr:hypothetical protein [Oscillospiraceae bacterium]
MVIGVCRERRACRIGRRGHTGIHRGHFPRDIVYVLCIFVYRAVFLLDQSQSSAGVIGMFVICAVRLRLTDNISIVIIIILFD